MAKSIGIHQLYSESPVDAANQLWGRAGQAVDRRGFLTKAALASLASVLGARVVFGENLPAEMIPAGLVQHDGEFAIPGKNGLIVLNDRPINAETPAHLLDDDVTPGKHLFIRNNGHPPAVDDIDPKQWSLRVEGESCQSPTSFMIKDLQKRFELHEYQLILECTGNGRSEFNPPAKGNQWSVGAVGCPRWRGVRLRDVLKSCGLKKDAVYVGYYGADTHLSGNPAKVPISRSVPISKAMEDECLIAFQMNGEDIPWLNGHPLRLVIPGWPASTSGKWLNRLVVRNQEHDGPKMGGQSYRVPKHPVAPGSSVPDEDMKIIEAMPVKSLVTFPKSGKKHRLVDLLGLRRHAWAGDRSIRAVHVSIDFGAT